MRWLLALCLSGGLSATADQRTFTADDVFNLEYASEVRVSPQGDSLVYVRRTNDIMVDRTRSNIWRMDIDGDNHRPVLSSRQSYTSPRWSPDGSRLAYLSSVEGDRQIYVRYLRTGDTALVTNVRQSPSSITWSPDGSLIAFTMRMPAKPAPIAKVRKKPKGAKWAEAAKVIHGIPYQRDGRGIVEPDYQQIFVVSAEGGQPQQLTSGEFNHGGALNWSPDGRSILFSANRQEGWRRQSRESDIFEVDVLTRELRQNTSFPGTESQPQYSPDGKVIAYIGGNNEPVSYRNTHLTTVSADGSNRNILTQSLDASVSQFYWGEKGRSLFIRFDEQAKRRIASVSLKGKVARLVDDLGGASLGRPYLSGMFHVGGGDVIGYTQGGSGKPANVGVIHRGKSQALTALNSELFNSVKLGEVKRIVYQSSYDNQEIEGWYVLPPNFDPKEKYPLILEIHGGPFLAYGDFFSAEAQLMASAGYVVFYDNHRGSASYGQDFAMLLDGNYSSPYDFADHMSGVDAMIEAGIADSENLFITGGSAGGIATAYAIGLTDKFNAAVAAKPVVNWVSKTLTADSSVGQIRNQFDGYPWENLEEYWRRSPLSLVGNVTTPTLLMTGEQDRRTPISETEQYFQALQLQGIPSAMVRFPDSPHGIAGRPSRLIAKVDNILAWFARYKVEASSSN